MGIVYSKNSDELNEIFPDQPHINVGASHNIIENMIEHIKYNDRKKALTYTETDTKRIMTAFIWDIVGRFSRLSDSNQGPNIKIKNFKRGTKDGVYSTYPVLNFDIVLKQDKEKYIIHCEVENDDYGAITYGMSMNVSFGYNDYQIKMLYQPRW